MVDDPPKSLASAIKSHFEWLAVYSEGRTFPLQLDEIEVEESPEKTLIGMHSDAGFKTWRVNEYSLSQGEVVLSISGQFGKEPQSRSSCSANAGRRARPEYRACPSYACKRDRGRGRKEFSGN